MAVEPFKTSAGLPVPAHARVLGPTSPLRTGHPLAGDTLRLLYAETVGDALRADTQQGLSLWLSGAAGWGRGLSPGDVLLVRVRAANPRMEVELLSQAPGAGRLVDDASAGAQEYEQASMRWDQAAMLGLMRRLPDAAMLAATWQALLRSYGQALAQRADLPPGRQAMAEPGGGSMLLPAAAPVQVEAVPAVPQSTLGLSGGVWAFPAYLWGGLPLTMHVFAASADSDGLQSGDDHASECGTWAAMAVLHLDMVVPGLGRILLQVHAPAPGAVSVLLHAQSDHALAQLRQLLPSITLVLMHAGLKLRACRLGTGRPDIRSGWAMRAPRWIDAMALTSDVFRAAAEVATLLVQQGAVEQSADTGR